MSGAGRTAQALASRSTPNIEVAGFSHGPAGVTATVAGEVCEEDYIVGCDGAQFVRPHEVPATLRGGALRPPLLCADVKGRGPASKAS